MQEIMCFSAFVYQYMESFVFLEVVRKGGGGGRVPIAPLNLSLDISSLEW